MEVTREVLENIMQAEVPALMESDRKSTSERRMRDRWNSAGRNRIDQMVWS